MKREWGLFYRILEHENLAIIGICFVGILVILILTCFIFPLSFQKPTTSVEGEF
jgi:hypothetical protein